MSEAALMNRRFGPAEGWQRLRFWVAYDGRDWQGWQSMPHGQTVQDQLNAALSRVCKRAVRCHGSGRTDAGVHALAQCGHVDVPLELEMDSESWVRAVNAVLAPSIRVLRVERAADAFHARYDACGKVYRYRIWRERILSPFEQARSWHVYGALDEAALRAGCELLVGRHDFARLSAFRGPGARVVTDTVRELRRVEIMRSDERWLDLEFEGDGFLYKMVRMLTGGLMQVARGRSDLAWLQDLLERPQGGAKCHFMAPAGGLYLTRVLYPAEVGRDFSPDWKM